MKLVKLYKKVIKLNNKQLKSASHNFGIDKKIKAINKIIKEEELNIKNSRTAKSADEVIQMYKDMANN